MCLSCGRGVFTGPLWYKKEEKESALRLYLKFAVNIHVCSVSCGDLCVVQNWLQVISILTLKWFCAETAVGQSSGGPSDESCTRCAWFTN